MNICSFSVLCSALLLILFRLFVPNIDLSGRVVVKSSCFHSSTSHSGLLGTHYSFRTMLLVSFSLQYSDALAPCQSNYVSQERLVVDSDFDTPQKHFHMILISSCRLSTSSSITDESLIVLLLILIVFLPKLIPMSCFRLILIILYSLLIFCF